MQLLPVARRRQFAYKVHCQGRPRQWAQKVTRPDSCTGQIMSNLAHGQFAYKGQCLERPHQWADKVAQPACFKAQLGVCTICLHYHPFFLNPFEWRRIHGDLRACFTVLHAPELACEAAMRLVPRADEATLTCTRPDRRDAPQV